jgi:hypothetical protein
MIALMFLAGIAVWLVVVSYLSKWIVGLLHPQWRKVPVRVFFFLVLLILPMADEIIGRWQFNRLCEREAVIWLSQDWRNVKRAIGSYHPREEVSEGMIRIYKTVIEYIDKDTGIVFLRDISYSTYGGFLFDRLGLGLGAAETCSSPTASEVYRRINLDYLVKQGEAN